MCDYKPNFYITRTFKQLLHKKIKSFFLPQKRFKTTMGYHQSWSQFYPMEQIKPFHYHRCPHEPRQGTVPSNWLISGCKFQHLLLLLVILRKTNSNLVVEPMYSNNIWHIGRNKIQKIYILCYSRHYGLIFKILTMEV